MDGREFLCYLVILHFCYVLFVPLFFSKIVLLRLHPVAGMSSCIHHLLVEFSFVILECPDLFVLLGLSRYL